MPTHAITDKEVNSLFESSIFKCAWKGAFGDDVPFTPSAIHAAIRRNDPRLIAEVGRLLEMNNAEIIELASMQTAVDQCPRPDDKELKSRIENILDGIGASEAVMVKLAVRLTKGKSCNVGSNDPKMMQRFRSLANYLGATVTEANEDSMDVGGRSHDCLPQGHRRRRG